MATNLLLEGDDLEALLIRAHAEGGVNARIVRAEKVRQGGLLGFFARERFEVAVEIPDDPVTAAVTAAATATVDTTTVEAATVEAAMVEAAMVEAAMIEATLEAPAPAVPRPGAGLISAPAADPEPGLLAAEGLLGLVDRVSAAERAAVRAAARMTARTLVTAGGGAGPGDGPAAGQDNGLRVDHPPQLIIPGDRAEAVPRYQGPDLSRLAECAAGSAGHRAAGHLDDAGPATGGRSAVPHEPPATPGRPSTARPEFSELLEQLRAGTLPPRPRSPQDLLGPPRPDHESDPERDPGRDAGRDRAVRAYAGEIADAAEPGPHPAQGDEAALLDGAAWQAASATADTRPADTRPTDTQPTDTQPTDTRPTDTRLAHDRRTLRNLGVPTAWTRRLPAGDRFSAVLRMLELMPDVDLDPDLPVVVVVGPAGVTRLEAHRTALDLHQDDLPRPVVLVPPDRHGGVPATAEARRLGPVVVALEVDGYACDEAVLETLRALRADAVIAVVDAGRPSEESQQWLDALGQVDAVVLDGAAAVTDPASVLQLGLPVVRLDGIPVDRVTWTALLCAQLEAAAPVR